MKRPRPKTIFTFISLAMVILWIPAGLWFQRHDLKLLGALNAGDVQAARQAFKEGATMRTPIKHHWTYLQVAARDGNVEMAKVLVEHGASATLALKNDEGKTALDIAIAHQRRELADYLRSLMMTNQTTGSR